MSPQILPFLRDISLTLPFPLAIARAFDSRFHRATASVKIVNEVSSAMPINE
jgi:hypothetical protein